MISGINSDDSSLMQFLISASRGLSGASNSGSTNESPEVQGGENGFLNCLNANFSKLDTNADNNLSKDEIKSFMKEHRPMGPPPGMFIENMDPSCVSSSAGNSGKTEGSDFKSALDNFVDKLDTNKDGVISADEIAAASEKNTDNNTSSKLDALSEVWQKFSDSDMSKRLLDQFSKKISEAYSSAMSSGSLSSLTDLVT